MGLRSVNFVVLPTQTLSNSQAPPFFLVEDFQSPGFWVKEVLGNRFQHALWEHYMAVLIMVVRVTIAIVDAIDELIKTNLLSFSEQTRSAVGWPIHCSFSFLGLDCERFVRSFLPLCERTVEVTCTGKSIWEAGGGGF